MEDELASFAVPVVVAAAATAGHDAVASAVAFVNADVACACEEKDV